eukprot:Blabericola_migrator_1__13544@NODE_991_length_5780_cov_117_704534_g683_i0_p2_GENE_NODE_991_length_5780_cov_117_704534_g683_i0NODE_991_length_5780_cov_117_704534_g683_i0_p2_ORF_typecomplete_len586_score131_71PRP3/PF08572_10/1_1e03PRP3/PF08572_10/2_3e56DUF1115/PF06544_12/5_6e22Activator_LAG3/PF11498_8/0_0029Activator_LAG3/PF11498_8/9e02CRISPR_assoc/PF08798_11/4_7e02CRISPR_assoc/PF08798_11/0_44DUF3947/PF13135_6/6_5RskA/PF10099_9/3_2RskA/PF10099_9/5_1e02AAA_23/PF13476_6/33AAA_23/PF13476_6/14_NODE_99
MSDEVVEPQAKKRKTRWGQAPTTSETTNAVIDATKLLSRQDIEARAEAARAAVLRATGGGAATVAAQQQLLALQQLQQQQQRQKSVTSVLESLRSRMAFQNESNAAKIPIKFDQLGRPLDEEGNVIPMVRPKYATLKINRNLEKDDRAIKASKANKINLKQYIDPTQNEWFDPSLKTSGNKLKRQALRFVESGFYAQRRAAKGGGDTPADNKGDLLGAGPIVSGRLTVPLQRKREDAFPELEWWDEPLVEKLPTAEISARQAARRWKNKDKPTGWSSDNNDTSIISVMVDGEEEVLPYVVKEMSIGHLVEHPVPVEPIAEKNPASIPVTMYLTKKERKKMRRRNRKERELEKQDKIRMGLIPPDPPKVKLSNLMRVLGQEQAANPTGVEAKVRKQIKQRLETHLEKNAARKATPEHKAERQKSKWLEKEETSEAITVSAYCISKLSRKNSVKINLNARQLQFTGVLIIVPNIGNLVVVEGGPRATRKFQALMLRRIQWDENEGSGAGEDGDEDADDDAPLPETLSKDKGCKLLWLGTVKERHFKNWRLHNCFTDADAIRVLTESKAVHYWDLLQRYRDRKSDMLM